MDHATRAPIYRQIEAERQTKVLAFVTGERLGLQTQIHMDAVEPFVALLDQIGPVPKLSLVLHTNGGQTSAAWRLINLLRSFGDEVEIIIPTKALSSGTLMSLGADRILMTKQAALGPIDPSVEGHLLAPQVVLPTGQTAHMPVSAEALRGYIDEVKKVVKAPDAMAAVWNQLASQIHPIVLGEVFRAGSQIRSLASDLIKYQVHDAKKANRIIQLLCSDSGSHDYTINRRQAASMGLNVEKPSSALYTLLSDIMKSYTAELKTFEPYSQQALLQGQAQASYTLVRGLIESTDGGCFGFVSDGVLQLQMQPGATVPNLHDNRTFEGWRKLP